MEPCRKPAAPLIALPFALMLGAAAQATPGDAALGAYLSAECTSCHQASGRQQGGIPAITGWPQEQFVAAMRAYRAKERENQVMQTVAARFSDEELSALAAHFAALPASR
jgi:cytochrome c553